MSDPRRGFGPGAPDPNQPQWSQPTEQIGVPYPPVDPAYGGQYTYPSYPPPASGPTGAFPPDPTGTFPPDPTQVLPPYWTQTQYPPPPPPPTDEPPEPPRSPRWLWLVAGGAVALVIGLVIALVVAYSSTRDDTAIAPLPPIPEPSTTVPQTTTTRTTTPRPTTTPPTTEPSATEPTTAPGIPGTTTTDEAATESVVYNVTGEGRAISITYVDTGGILQMEFNVALPWTREVSLTPSSVKAASVTVINVGREISCSITLNGAQTQQRSGSGLTICSSIGG